MHAEPRGSAHRPREPGPTALQGAQPMRVQEDGSVLQGLSAPCLTSKRPEAGGAGQHPCVTLCYRPPFCSQLSWPLPAVPRDSRLQHGSTAATNDSPGHQGSWTHAHLPALQLQGRPGSWVSSSPR